VIEKTIEDIEERIRSAASMQGKDKEELLRLLSTLKTEVVSFAETHPEEAQSIAHFTQASTHEATREEKNPQLLKLSTKGLTSSIEGFEESHPELVKIVNSISVMLSGMGI
jgi:hypothetical protein